MKQTNYWKDPTFRKIHNGLIQQRRRKPHEFIGVNILDLAKTKYKQFMENPPSITPKPAVTEEKTGLQYGKPKMQDGYEPKLTFDIEQRCMIEDYSKPQKKHKKSSIWNF